MPKGNYDIEYGVIRLSHSKGLFTMRLELLFMLLATSSAQAASEEECQQAFTQWMVTQQQQFSDRKASDNARRNAERAIDQAREEYDKQESFCQTMEWVKQKRADDPSIQPQAGEIQNFRR